MYLAGAVLTTGTPRFPARHVGDVPRWSDRDELADVGDDGDVELEVVDGIGVIDEELEVSPPGERSNGLQPGKQTATTGISTASFRTLEHSPIHPRPTRQR